MFAAASLKATFTEIGTIFQTENPGSTVTFNFAGSSDLVTQLTAGAPADVFASADTNNMTKATTANLVSGTPVNFASNILTIVTPPGNPAGITGFADLANPGRERGGLRPAGAVRRRGGDRGNEHRGRHHPGQ